MPGLFDLIMSATGRPDPSLAIAHALGQAPGQPGSPQGPNRLPARRPPQGLPRARPGLAVLLAPQEGRRAPGGPRGRHKRRRNLRPPKRRPTSGKCSCN